MVRSLFAFALLSGITACAVTPAATPIPPDATPPAAASPEIIRAATPAPKPKVTYNQCNVDGPFIAMTYDDGPHATNTPRLLDMLKQRGIKATFFVVGQCAAEYPDIMKRIVVEGHEIANHSWSHPQLSRMGEGAVSDQLQRTHDVIIQTTGATPRLMRPPFGAFTQNQMAWANRKWDYKVIMWDVDPLDWKYRNAGHVKSEILSHTVNGSIILTHDIHKTTIDAMPETLDGLTARGFKFLTVSELIAMDRPMPAKPKATPAPKPSATPEPAVPPESGPPKATPPATNPAKR